MLLNRQKMAFIVPCMAAIFVCGLSVQALGVDATAEEQRPINIDVRDMAIGDVLRMLGQAANVNIIVGQGVSGDVQSLTLRNVSVETALRTITQAHGYYWHKDGNIYIVSSEPRSIPEAPAPAAEMRPARAIEGAAGQPPEAQAYPSVIPPPPADTDRPGQPSPPHAEPPRILSEMIMLSYATARDVAMMFGGGIAPNASQTMRGGRGDLSAANRSSGTSDLGSMRAHRSALGPYGMPQFDADMGPGGGFGAGMGGLGGGLQPGVGTGVGTAARTGTTAGGAITLPGEMQPPVAILSHNALLVRGTREEIDEFREMLSLLDTPAKQVEIATKWIDVASVAARSLGIDWAVTNGAWEIFNLGFAPAEAANQGVRYGRGRWWAQLAALETTDQATVINEPRIVCMNGMPGMIVFETEIPYFSANITYNQFGQRTVDFSAEFISVSNQLMVVPQINPDDSVQMMLAPQLQDQVGTVSGPEGEVIPIVTSQFIETMVRVHDGETVVLGGVIRGDESINVRRVPLLSEIPIIGRLFTSRRVDHNHTELLIFVTPRIVRDRATE
jgi:type II secretory pathway component GspD/PulD (secretin)